MSVSVIFSVFELSNIYDRKEKRGKKKKLSWQNATISFWCNMLKKVMNALKNSETFTKLRLGYVSKIRRN